ncbi:zinc finger RNA-binding protein-like [Senna tora]|uniref:Zinc finger RNA-binding protein-like n=1 Tax=Senna tora TaxID=362788 RepID=A0A834VYW8_9FABA|nr:zinc finger RNA-binding protein-like [Senna tora]
MSSNPVIGPQSQVEEGKSGKNKSKRTAKEISEDLDLERKKMKILKGGVANVKICIVCKVAYNSDAVYRQHMAGRKHMKKLATSNAG